jgi:betaine-aldehyde dehydrogenase
VAKDLHNFINGDAADTKSGRRSDLVNPSTGEIFATAPVSDSADVDAAFDAASAAFDGWRDATPSERSLALLRIADALEARAEELVAAESENTGKPFGLTMSEEIPPMADQIRFFAGAARMLEGRSAAEYMTGFTSFIRRERPASSTWCAATGTPAAPSSRTRCPRWSPSPAASGPARKSPRRPPPT